MIRCNKVEFRGCNNPDCRTLHLVLVAAGAPVATIDLPLEDVGDFISHMQTAAYKLATEKDVT